MSVAKDIASIIDANETFILGENLFISQLPEGPDEAIAVYEMSGASYDAIAELNSTTVSLKARATTYERAYEIISNASEEIACIGDEKYSSTGAGVGIDDDNDDVYETIYLRVAPNNEPYPMGRDASERVEFAQSFTVTFFRNAV